VLAAIEYGSIQTCTKQHANHRSNIEKEERDSLHSLSLHAACMQACIIDVSFLSRIYRTRILLLPFYLQQYSTVPYSTRYVYEHYLPVRIGAWSNFLSFYLVHTFCGVVLLCKEFAIIISFCENQRTIVARKLLRPVCVNDDHTRTDDVEE
jgi:hypothetical protein